MTRRRATEPGRLLTLAEVSERLGVHYMTAYRHVRTGRLAAEQSADGRWLVRASDLPTHSAPRTRRHSGSVARLRVGALVDRLVAGDEPGAWAIAEAALAGGAAPARMYVELFAPAMRRIGERWARGGITVADEHCATVTMQRLLGRAGPLFARRGRTRGIVLLGAPAGELHALPTALAADILRGDGYAVIDLGADVPTDSFVACAARLPRVTAIGVAVSASGNRRTADDLVRGLRALQLPCPVILGGAASDPGLARAAGADAWAADVMQLLGHVAAAR